VSRAQGRSARQRRCLRTRPDRANESSAARRKWVVASVLFMSLRGSGTRQRRRAASQLTGKLKRMDGPLAGGGRGEPLLGPSFLEMRRLKTSAGPSLMDARSCRCMKVVRPPQPPPLPPPPSDKCTAAARIRLAMMSLNGSKWWRRTRRPFRHVHRAPRPELVHHFSDLSCERVALRALSNDKLAPPNASDT
jgi:hypothetical protein